MKQINFESGRSMVEMLGTLAIIGVLSVGAIAGYSYGMNKYRANQTIHDISLRTVDLMTQASQGRATLSLAEWDKETTIYDFANPAYSDDGLIMFDVGTTKKIPQSVCQMVFDGLANTAVQIDINAERADSNETCGTDNTMTFYFEGGGSGTTDTGGETGEQCGDTICGTCQKCDSATETCVTVSDYEAKCTTDDNKTGWCISGACEPDTTCNCGKGYYCTDTNDSDEHPTPSGNCVEAKTQFKEEVIDGTTYYISNDPMSWWDAVSACKALGNKSLLSHHELTIPCNQADDTGCSSVGTKLNTLGKALYSKMGDPYIWSSILYDSYRAYYVYLGDSGGDSTFRNTSHFYYALCR